jgi:hypothetical protein
MGLRRRAITGAVALQSCDRSIIADHRPRHQRFGPAMPCHPRWTRHDLPDPTVARVSTIESA